MNLIKSDNDMRGESDGSIAKEEADLILRNTTPLEIIKETEENESPFRGREKNRVNNEETEFKLKEVENYSFGSIPMRQTQKTLFQDN